jgi:pentatricopeptide repeat protein
MRVGDIFCTMFEFYCKSDQNEKAWAIVEEMREGSYQISRYLDREILDSLCAKIRKVVGDGGGDGMGPWGGMGGE